METKDHLMLAKHLVKKFGKDMKGYEKAAFVIGNIIPDINPFTYLTFGRNNILGGHSLGYRKESIQKYLSSKKSFNILWWYRFGEILHYLCDSFTTPHNESAGMTLAEHAEYEHELHFALMGVMKMNIQFDNCGSSLHYWLEQKYEKHSRKLKSLYFDGFFIIHASFTVFHNIYLQSRGTLAFDYI